MKKKTKRKLKIENFVKSQKEQLKNLFYAIKKIKQIQVNNRMKE